MTMRRLTEIIGPAPSEVSPDEHISILTRERDRVRSALQLFRSGYDPSPKGKGKVKPEPKAKKAKPQLSPIFLELQKAGLSLDQIEQLIKATQGGKNEGRN